MGNAAKAATTYKDGTHSIDEVVHGIDIGSEISPVGHGARWGKQAAEQHETHHEEPHHEDGLLHGI